jgi:D-glycero-D-manno-heptose 1,7-bisphosphate phosphatase
MDKVIFLDRDGTINESSPKGGYIISLDTFKFIPGALAAIRDFCAMGYKVVVVTNQRSVHLGIMTEGLLDKTHKMMREEAARAGGEIAGIYFCPHDFDACDCRKPKTGMFDMAEKELALDIDKAASFMIGDSPNDVRAGQNFGLKTIFIKNKSYNQRGLEREADFTANDLSEAVDIVAATATGAPASAKRT